MDAFNMNDKEQLLKKKLKNYFTKPRLMLMKNIIDHKTPVSIRKLEWFISIYCKKHNVQYKVNGKMFNVYNSYKNEQLKSYSKKYFDFFRRNNTFEVKIQDKETIETTVAQMNFFKWVIENEIIQYVEANIVKITNEMNKEKNKKDKKIVASVYVIRNDIIISFD
jgi:hypothetical protein